MNKRETEVAKNLKGFTKDELLTIQSELNLGIYDIKIDYYTSQRFSVNGTKILGDVLKYTSDTILNSWHSSINDFNKIKEVLENLIPGFEFYRYGEGVDYLEIIDAILYTKKELLRLVKDIDVEDADEKEIKFLKLLYLKLSIENL